MTRQRSTQRRTVQVILLAAILVIVAGCAQVQNAKESYSQGCNIFVGKIWCEEKQQCIKFWSDSCAKPERSATQGDQPIISQADEHGCSTPAGYMWCEPKKRCIKAMDEACE